MASCSYETDRHSCRVASLARQIVQNLRADPVVCGSLWRAALEHQKFRLSRLRGKPVLPGLTGQILRVFAGACDESEPSVTAASILSICDTFDETVEFAVYEGQPLPAAIEEFFSGNHDWPRPVYDALREFAWSRAFTSGPARLPVLPAAASELLRTSAETISAAELAAIAGRDPILAARLLAVANSAALGPRGTIKTLREAVLRVGVPLARKALVAAALTPLFASARLFLLWKHSREAAAIAHELAPACGCDPDEAWLTGLLHDIGRLIFETGPTLLNVRERDLLRAGFPLTYAETLIRGTDHAEAGADLAAHWNLPASLIDAIRHHTAPELTNAPLPALLYLADSACTTTEADEPPDLAASFRKAHALAATGLSPSTLDSLTRDFPIFALAS